AFLFFRAATGFLGGAVTLLGFPVLGVLERPTASLHLIGGEILQNHTRTLGRRGARRFIDRRRDCHGSGLRGGVGLLRLDRDRLRPLARHRELALLGLDDNRLRAAVRKVLAHGTLFHTRALQRQGLLGIDAQRLVVTRFRVAHSVSSAAFSSSATAASIATS